MLLENIIYETFVFLNNKSILLILILIITWKLEPKSSLKFSFQIWLIYFY